MSEDMSSALQSRKVGNAMKIFKCVIAKINDIIVINDISGFAIFKSVAFNT